MQQKEEVQSKYSPKRRVGSFDNLNSNGGLIIDKVSEPKRLSGILQARSLKSHYNESNDSENAFIRAQTPAFSPESEREEKDMHKIAFTFGDEVIDSNYSDSDII